MDLFNTAYFEVLYFDKYAKGRILETYIKKLYSVGNKFVDLQDKFLFKILVAVQKKKKSLLIALFWLE